MIVVPFDGYLETFVEDEYEKVLKLILIPPNEISVKFDQISAL